MTEAPCPPRPEDIAHEWTRNDPRWPGLRDMTFCVRCGVVQRYDGKNKPCSGKLAPITLRELPPFEPENFCGDENDY